MTATQPAIRPVLADVPTVVDRWPGPPPARTPATRRRRRWGLAETCAVMLGAGLLPWAFLLGLHVGWLL